MNLSDSDTLRHYWRATTCESRTSMTTQLANTAHGPSLGPMRDGATRAARSSHLTGPTEPAHAVRYVNTHTHAYNQMASIILCVRIEARACSGLLARAATALTIALYLEDLVHHLARVDTAYFRADRQLKHSCCLIGPYSINRYRVPGLTLCGRVEARACSDPFAWAAAALSIALFCKDFVHHLARVDAAYFGADWQLKYS